MAFTAGLPAREHVAQVDRRPALKVMIALLRLTLDIAIPKRGAAVRAPKTVDVNRIREW